MVLRGKRYKKEKKTVLGTFRNALNGIIYTYSVEINFKIHLLVAVLVLLFSYILELSKMEVIVCILLIGLVLAFELINTVVEMIVDMVEPHEDPLAGMIKDASSGAVLVIAVTSAVVGLIIFIPKLYMLFV